MPTLRETILAARLSALPERVPAKGLLILRHGDPREPEVTLSPKRYHYQGLSGKPIFTWIQLKSALI